MGAKEANILAKQELERSKGIKCVPWGGVAARIQFNGDGFNCHPVTGRAYCFLPLPVVTNLSVQVNGYFVVGADRRDVWKDDRGDLGNSKVQWYAVQVTRFKNSHSPGTVHVSKP